MATQNQIDALARLMETSRLDLEDAFKALADLLLPMESGCSLVALETAKRLVQCRQAEGVYSLKDVCEHEIFDSALVINFGGRRVNAVRKIYNPDSDQPLYVIIWSGDDSWHYSGGDIHFVVKGIVSSANWLDKVKPMKANFHPTRNYREFTLPVSR